MDSRNPLVKPSRQMDASFCPYSYEEVAAMARPKTGETPKHNVRVPDPLWEAATKKAKEEGRTITDVIVTALHRYVASPTKPS
uniref:hypothetical protein n=1 Tax=Streptomyces tubercidicus TaxID=47759 RepID=UPI0037DD261B